MIFRVYTILHVGYGRVKRASVRMRANKQHFLAFTQGRGNKQGDPQGDPYPGDRGEEGEGFG